MSAFRGSTPEGSRAGRGIAVDSRRARLAIGLVLVMTLVSARSMLLWPPAAGPDVIDYEMRFAKLRQELPLRGIVGYVSDSSFVGDFFLTQYELAPRVVYPRATLPPSVPDPIVIGNFNSPVAVPDVLSKNRLAITRNFGSGVLLLRPEGR